MRAWLIIALLTIFFIKSAECQVKRSSMGGSAFGSLDRIPLSYLRKFYRQKTTKRDENEFMDSPRDSQMGYRSISFWPLY
uniref:Neuropeptide n=1 Tax=Caenorhabditis tropicalis TaxID=1561998 RepID=A0A1I7THR2_9PELO